MAYHSFGGEVEASNTPTIRRLTSSRRHQLQVIAPEKDAKPYIVNFKLADPDSDGTVDKKEFEAACAKGLVTYTNH